MSKISRKMISGCLAIAFAITMAVTPAMAFGATDTSSTTTRIGGIDRYETAAKVAQTGWTASEYAVLSAGSDANLVDALTASPLAKLKNAPILLTQGNALNAYAEKELTRLKVKTAYVTSGIGVIKQPVLDKLSSMGITVVSLGGKDRFETAVNIAKQFTDPKKIIVATAWSNADALSVSSIAAANSMPILLTNAASLPTSVKSYIDGVSAKLINTYVIGGTAVVGDSVLNSLSKAARVAGANRYATNTEILKTFYGLIKPGKVFIANGQDAHLVDSLAAASYAALTASTIVLTDTSMPAASKEYVKKYLLPNKLVAIGGENVVTADALSGLNSYTAYGENNSTHGSANASQPELVKEALRITGNDIKVANLTADYSIYITGNNASLENVKVKGSVFIDPGPTGSANLTKVTADKIVVLSGAKDSIHISQSASGELVVTSRDDQGTPSTVRVVAEQGTTIGNTTVTTYSIIDAATGVEMGKVIVTSIGGAAPTVELKGSFTEEVVLEANADVTVAAGSAIASMNRLGNGTLNVAEGANIGSLSGNTSGVSGSGMIGDKPADQVNSGGIGDGGGGGGATQLTVSSVKALTSVPAHDQTDSTNTFDYSFSNGVLYPDSVKLKGLNVQANATGATMVMTSITAKGYNWIESGKTINHVLPSSGEIKVSDIFGLLDNGDDGISLKNLRMVLGTGTVQIKGYLAKSGYTDSSEMTVNIVLGGTSGSAAISNDWMTITKSGTTITVDVKPGMGSTKMRDMTAGSAFDFVKVVIAIALDGLDYSSGDAARDALQLKIINEVPGYVFNDIPLSLLVGKNVQFTSGGTTYTVTFIQSVP